MLASVKLALPRHQLADGAAIVAEQRISKCPARGHLDRDPLHEDAAPSLGRSAGRRCLPLEASTRGAGGPPCRFLYSTEEGHCGREWVLAPTSASQAAGRWTLTVEGCVFILGWIRLRDRRRA